MILVTEKITEREVEKRFNSLPENLKRALYSETNLKIVNRACRNHYLTDEEKILMVQQIAALVFLGFIHSYDLSSEINGELELNNPKLADSIAKELEAKIFAPLKLDLENNYSPLVEEGRLPIRPNPVTVEEIKKPEKSGMGIPATPITMPISIKSIPIPTPITAAKPQGTPLPIPLSVAAESKTPPTPRMAPVPPTKPVSPNKTIPETPTISAPVIIHQEEELRTLKPPPSTFHLAEEKSIFEKASQKPPTMPPPIARIEIGNLPPRTPKEIPPSRIVNYSETRTPLSETKTKSAPPVPAIIIQNKPALQPTKPSEKLSQPPPSPPKPRLP